MGEFRWMDELVESGDFVDAAGLAAPVHAGGPVDVWAVTGIDGDQMLGLVRVFPRRRRRQRRSEPGTTVAPANPVGPARPSRAPKAGKVRARRSPPADIGCGSRRPGNRGWHFRMDDPHVSQPSAKATWPAEIIGVRQLTPHCGVPKVWSLFVCDGHDALPVAARMLVAAHTGCRPGPGRRAGRPGHRRPRRRRRARPGRLRAEGRGPALAELMPCSRVTTCGIGPNPALPPTRSRPDPTRSRQGAACH
jgi:hypothetical protein